MFKLFGLFLAFLVVGGNAQVGLQSPEEPLPLKQKGGGGGSGGIKLRNDDTLAWRLNRNILPTLYQLTLTPVLQADQGEVGEQWSVNGKAAIHVSVNVDTENITLHVKDLDIISFGIEAAQEEDVRRRVVIEEAFYQEDYDFFTLKAPFTAGSNYIIHFEYKAKIQEELHGLYRSMYVDPTTGEEEWIATTQMEALHARELFPCFDEPSFKAVFEVTIGHHVDHVALANAPSNMTTEMEGVEGWVWETFEPTPIMSTYLFAIIISKFTYAQATEVKPGLTVRSYAPKHSIDVGAGEYSANLGAQILAFYETYFEQEYPISKMDQAAVPDFFFGAMENFGLNIYRESALLIFEDDTTETERLSVSEVLAHELAHQWFGNLVTAAFWTHIWLNEGFASYVEYIGLSHTNPEFEAWDLFLVENLQRALTFDLDSNAGNHPVKIVEAEWTKRDAMDWFDTIVYQKGACLNKMMEGFLSLETFHNGLCKYQARMKWSGATQDDLFQDLHEVAIDDDKLPGDSTMKEVMDTWTLQTGFPLLTLTSNGDTFSLKQDKFGNTDSPDLWSIPVSIATKEMPDFDPAPEHWLLEKELKDLTKGAGWILGNAGATGYYRVHYDPENEQLLEDQLLEDHEVIGHLSRTQLFDDYFAFAWSAMVPINRTLGFTKYLSLGEKGEDNYIIWRTVLKELVKTLNLFGSAGLTEHLEAYLLPGLEKAILANGGFQVIGNLEDKGTLVLNQKLLVDWACALGHQACEETSLGFVEMWMKSLADGEQLNPIHRDYRPILYCAANKASESPFFNFFWDLYKNGGAQVVTTKQKGTILNSLACTGEDAHITMLLDGSIEEGFYNNMSHGITVLRQLAGNVKARQHLLAFLDSKFEELVAFHGNLAPITQSIQALSTYMSTQEELDQIETFITSHVDEIGESLNMYVQTIKNNIQWISDFGNDISKFFIDNALQDPTSEPTEPTSEPTSESTEPTSEPSSMPTGQTSEPTSMPTEPTSGPTSMPTGQTSGPTSMPTGQTSGPTSMPTGQTSGPTSMPTGTPAVTTSPTTSPTEVTDETTETNRSVVTVMNMSLLIISFLFLFFK